MYKYILTIEGMKCSMCEAHINDIIRKNFDVKKLKSSHKKNITSFISDDSLDEELLKDVISTTGYKLIDINITK